MSMVLICYQASDATIDRILADPPLVWQLVAPDEPEFYSDARAASVGMLGKLFGRERSVEPLQLAEHEGELGDLDKAWHGIDFLLTRGRDAVAHGLDFLTEGGIEIRGQEVGYGTARAFRSTEVRTIARARRRVMQTLVDSGSGLVITLQ